MDFSLTADQQRYRDAVREVCARFPDTYWRELDARKQYPEEFVDALTKGGWLSVLIPTEYGGAGLGMVEACIVLEEINASGGNAAACHAQMYTMGALLRYGSETQKKALPPRDRRRPAAPAIDGGHRTRGGQRHHPHHHTCPPR